MMRIKEAIMRKKIIQQLHEEWTAYEEVQKGEAKCARKKNSQQSRNSRQSAPTPTPEKERPQTVWGGIDEAPLIAFVEYLSNKMKIDHKRALKVTWKRMSEAPRTSGRGNIHIMEKVLHMMCEREPDIQPLFYKCAFVSCIKDRMEGRRVGRPISTMRDHAHILVELVDRVVYYMFESNTNPRPPPAGVGRLDPQYIGQLHSRLHSLGFDRRVFHVLGECFAEVLFNQECVRAFPHAPAAWSLLALSFSDKMYTAAKPPTTSTTSASLYECNFIASFDCNGNPLARSAPPLPVPPLIFSTDRPCVVREPACKIFVRGTSLDSELPPESDRSLYLTPPTSRKSMRLTLFSEEEKNKLPEEAFLENCPVFALPRCLINSPRSRFPLRKKGPPSYDALVACTDV